MTYQPFFQDLEWPLPWSKSDLHKVPRLLLFLVICFQCAILGVPEQHAVQPDGKLQKLTRTSYYRTFTLRSEPPPCPSCVPNSTFIREKKHLILAWFVSHCQTHGKREEYWDRLSKYISGDKYGRCGNKSLCPKGRKESCAGEGELLQRYKFYFSAENSICKDYVSGEHNVMAFLLAIAILWPLAIALLIVEFAKLEISCM